MQTSELTTQRRKQRPPRVANYSQRRAIERFMLENSKLSPDGTYRIWNEGWSYRRAAQSVHRIFDAGHAQRIAQSLGVRFLPPSLSNTAILEKLAEQDARIAGIDVTVTELAKELRAMIYRPKAA